jgi:hypothetical protein
MYVRIHCQSQNNHCQVTPHTQIKITIILGSHRLCESKSTSRVNMHAPISFLTFGSQKKFNFSYLIQQNITMSGLKMKIFKIYYLLSLQIIYDIQKL